MHAQPSTDGIKFEIVMSRDELILINNALNEVCNGIDIREFSTRLGASRSEAEELLDAIGKLID
jgi:hypothetical protein